MVDNNKRNRVTVRLNDEQMECIASKSTILGISPSDFIRMLINSLIYTERNAGKVADILTQPNEAKALEVLGRENDKTTKHD